jgi:hypothetical protein
MIIPMEIGLGKWVEDDYPDERREMIPQEKERNQNH